MKNIQILREDGSKSNGNILNPIEILEKYGIDELRYYLMKEVSHGSDGNISLNSLEKCFNSDLANNFGNLCQRVFSFVKTNCDNKVNSSLKLMVSDKKLINDTKNITDKLRELMDDQNLNSYIKSVIDISFLTNKYVNDEEPWKLKNTNVKRMNDILFISLEQIAKISILLNPIIPEKSTKVLDALNIDTKLRNLTFLDGKKIIDGDVMIKKLDILFKKVT